MAIESEMIQTRVLYGTKGPDKWSFLMDGVLDPQAGRDNARFHEFTIEGRPWQISIENARPIPAWQCPPHPAIELGRHDHDWSEAWEFTGIVSGGHHVLAIYSPWSRKGVFLFWDIRLAGHMDCTDCRQDIHTFFAVKGNSDALLALTRAMEHMVRGSALGGYHVDCVDCWGLFRQLRQSVELP